MDNRRITTKSLSDLTEKMKDVLPKSDAIPVFFLCSAIATFGKKPVQFPPNCIAMTRETLIEYHGPFTSRAVSYTRTNPNTANKTTLMQLLSCPLEVAAAVKDRSNVCPFVTFRDLQEFLQEKHGFSLGSAVRPFLLLVDNDDEEDDGSVDSDGDDIVDSQDTGEEADEE
jgi:hypothetical protein